MNRIDIKPVSLQFQKITEAKEIYLEIYERYIKYVVRFAADEPLIEDDENSGWENIITDFEVIALKKNIAGIEKTYIEKQHHWKVSIMVSGFAFDIQMFFKRQSEMEPVY